MDQSTQPQRSKSFKALATAQPIRKQIEQTLNKLEQEKRKFLANDREECLLKEQLEKKRKQLNQFKAKVPETINDDKRTTQTSLKLKNSDRTYQLTINNIQKLKDNINVARRQVGKFKFVNTNLASEQDMLEKNIKKLIDDIVKTENSNDQLKQQISTYREMNMRNLAEFRKSHINMEKSNMKEENQRRRYAVTTHTFLGEENKHSRMIHSENISDLLRNSGLLTNEGKVDIMTESVPLAKTRVKQIVHKNRQKIRIAEDFKKFGSALQQMFEQMKQYKGRDDVNYLAEEFVAKEKQIQKLGQYISKLEYRIVSADRELEKKQNKEDILENQLQDTENQADVQYMNLNQHVEEDIKQLKQNGGTMIDWLKKVGEILCPLTDDNDFSRGNAKNVLGKIQEILGVERSDQNKKEASPIKQLPTPQIEIEDHFQRYNQLLDYDKMKQYAQEYIKSKK